MKTRLALTAALVTLVAFGGGTALAARSNESTEEVRWISQVTQFVFVLANGDRPDPKTLGGRQPQPGDQFFEAEDLFETQDGTTRGRDRIGTSVIHCLFGAANHLHCDGTVFLEGGQLHFETTFPIPEERFEIDIAFDGGTGEFRDAGGDAHLTDVSPENHEVTQTLWEVRLLHLDTDIGSLLDVLGERQ